MDMLILTIADNKYEVAKEISDLIISISKERDELKKLTKMKWIKCSDKLPEKREKVFVWVVPYDNRINPFASIDEYNIDWVHNFKATITDWMYIQEP